MSEFRHVGARLPLVDGPAKLRGEAPFGADDEPARTLIARYMPSPHAHAEILSIDTSAAEAMPGVAAVVTGADLPDSEPSRLRNRASLAREHVVFKGQPVAAVAAVDADTASAALENIEVEYRVLPTVADAHEARSASSAIVGPAGTSNVAKEDVVEWGDATVALEDSATVVHRVFTIPVQHQGYIEPHTVTAWWDRHDHLTVWEPTQGVADARDELAADLDTPQSRITFNGTSVGGGFGGKAKGMFTPIPALLSAKARRPVRLTLTRTEEFFAANPAPGVTIDLSIGADADGTLTAIAGEVVVDGGAFAEPNYPIAQGIATLLHVNYRWKACSLNAVEVVTNKVSYGAYRAPGSHQAAFAIESLLDELASDLGIDPIELRMRNVIQEGDQVEGRAAAQPNGAKHVLAALREHPAWTDPPAPARPDRTVGRGIAMGRFGSGPWPGGAVAKIEAEGTLRFVIATVDLTGSYTSLTQIAAETLGISPDRIVLTKASLDHAPHASVSGGSGTIYGMESAVHAAAADLRAKLLARGAAHLDDPEENVELDDEGVFVVDEPPRSVSYRYLYQLETELGAALYPPLVATGSIAPESGAPTYAACIADVEVDPETGAVSVVRLTAAQDVGTAINPMLVEGQIQGGVAQGVGMALWEQVVYADGDVLNPSFKDYHMPTAADLPPIDTILVSAPGGVGPFGAKGVGEPPIVPPAAAIANAVKAATGARVTSLPLTPERVWQAMSGS